MLPNIFFQNHHCKTKLEFIDTIENSWKWMLFWQCDTDLHTVSRCHTRGESEDHTNEKAWKKGSTLALKSREDITISPQQPYQWTHERDLCPVNFFFKKREKL